MSHQSRLHIIKGGSADLEDKVIQVTGRIWDRRMEQTPAITAEVTGDQAEWADTETVRPADISLPRDEGIKTMEAKELVRRYNAGKRNFERANLSGANLSMADLAWANLSAANVTSEQLDKAASLKGAAMPDGTKLEQAVGAGW